MLVNYFEYLFENENALYRYQNMPISSYMKTRGFIVTMNKMMNRLNEEELRWAGRE